MILVLDYQYYEGLDAKKEKWRNLGLERRDIDKCTKQDG
jgi:hypothetical protein